MDTGNQKLKVLATKAEDLSSIPQTHMVGRTDNTHKFSVGFHMHAVHMQPHTECSSFLTCKYYIVDNPSLSF